MAGTTTRDMTHGSPFQLISGFFVPMVFGLLFQQLYNMVDTIIVGKYLGVSALASVGSTGCINFMVVGFCTGVCSGFAIPVAQKFGEKNFSQLRRFAANGAWLAAGFSLAMTTAVCILCRRILVWLNTPADIMDGAYDYIFVIFLGIPAIVLYNLCSGFIRSLGDSKTPLLFLGLSSVSNVILDLYTIIGLQMGVAGAAWATVISQGISGICCLVFMLRHYEVLRMTKEEIRPDKNIMLILCNMGVPMGLQYSITAIGSVLLQTAVNGLGSAAVASVTAGSKISMFLCCPFEALGGTMATYGGQNIGARKLERIDNGLKAAVGMGAVYSVIAFGAVYFFGDTLSLLFLNAGQTEILGQVRTFLLLNVIFFFPLSLVIIFRFLIQGMGYSRVAVLAGVSEMAARTAASFFLVPFFGYPAVCFASPLAWMAADAFLIPVYFRIMKQLRTRRNVRKC